MVKKSIYMDILVGVTLIEERKDIPFG